MPINLDLSPRIVASDIENLLSVANAKSSLGGKPYRIINFLPWLASTSYSVGDAVTFNGDIFRCTVAANTNPPYSLNGWAGVNDRGAWSAGTYNLLDKVTYSGSTYIATATTTLAPLDGSGNLNAGWSQLWLSAFNRLRAKCLSKFSTNDFKKIVSGPWPLTNTTQTVYGGFSGVGGTTISNVDSVDFYYAYATASATVSMVWDGFITSYDPSQSSSVLSKTARFQIIVSGDPSVAMTFNGKFVIKNFLGPDFSTAGCTSDFPSATFTNVAGVLSATVSGATVYPGTYTFNCTFGGSGGYYSGSFLDCTTDGTSVRARLSVTCPETTVAVNGIHNSLSVWKKPTTKPPIGSDYGFGIYSNNGGWINGTSGSVYTSSIQGIWFGKSFPINTLGMSVQTSMPWNLFVLPSGSTPSTSSAPPQSLSQPYQVGTSAPYNYTRAYSTPWEKQNTNPAWVASTWYPAGFIIRDSNGNLQRSGGGKSGSSAPTWATSGTTTDNTITWTFLSSPVSSIATGRARMYSVPNYPVIWDDDIWQASTAVLLGQQIRDTNGEIRVCSQAGVTGSSQPSWGSGGSASIVTPNWGMEGTAAEITDGTAKWRPYMAGFNPRGWWIYRLNINRVSTPNNVNTASGSGSVGAGASASGAGAANIAVEVGIYRSGSFVSFGTYQTGANIAAMWPIFTNTPLVYRAAERVDVQASIISCGNSFTTDGSVTYPICAAYYNDIENLLNQI